MNDTRRCGVLFADIAGNTALHQRLGDAAAVRLVQDLVGRMSDLVAEHGGRVIKSDGDDVLAVFERPEPADAANAAVALQLAAHDAGLSLYVGVHCGAVEFREVLGRPDVLGLAVNFAARLHKLVPDAPGQIFLAGEYRSVLQPALAARTEPFGRRQLKGIGEVEVYTLQWREALTTVMPTRYAGAPVRGALPLRLVLRHGDSARTLGGGDDGAVLIGRAKDAFLRINDPELKVSSSHLRLELRAGGWFALDRSRNGTWLADAATGEETLLLGTDAPLPRRGALCLGRGFAEDAAGQFTLHFETLA